ncbi:MAG: hypothetical protein OXN89_10390 [Bryobacterales bacterium]|nr:hypothetical protein [Bryobacterales bacterium]
MRRGLRRPEFSWPRAVHLALLTVFALIPSVPMPVVDCPCDHTRPESMRERVCSLCGTAERAQSRVYFLKDINPHKPSRHLALPKAHDAGFQSTAHLPPDLRSDLWRGAAERAEQLYPGAWGVAQNSHYFRTQCHAHLHIGPLSPEVDDTGGQLYYRFEDFPNVGPERGVWMHPKQAGYCVHLDRDLAEIVLVR